MPDSQDWLEAYENAPAVTRRELLRRAGYEPPPPAAVVGFQLRGRLWEMIYALAARHIFLSATNHLSDIDLYIWLHDEWLSEETVELPAEAGWSCTVLPAGSGNARDAAIHLRFHAGENERARWAESFPEETLPPHEPAPFDRDRFLPAAPEPPGQAERSGLPELNFVDHENPPGDAPFDTPETDDPLGLNQVDREIRRELRKAASEEAGPARPLREEHEPFEHVAKFDQDGWQRPHEELARSGVVLLPPDELTDETVGSRLWELLHELACRGFYVLNTDHLSDREAYSNLWREDLREPAILPGRSRHGGWFHDFVGSGSEEHTQVWLRYFASDEARASHARDWPESPLPPRETPRFKRDWRLPKGPF